MQNLLLWQSLNTSSCRLLLAPPASLRSTSCQLCQWWGRSSEPPESRWSPAWAPPRGRGPSRPWPCSCHASLTDAFGSAGTAAAVRETPATRKPLWRKLQRAGDEGEQENHETLAPAKNDFHLVILAAVVFLCLPSWTNFK